MIRVASSFTTRALAVARQHAAAGRALTADVANHDATPGIKFSLGTTSGRICSVACWQPDVAAAAPVVATILKSPYDSWLRALVVHVTQSSGACVCWVALDCRWHCTHQPIVKGGAAG